VVGTVPVTSFCFSVITKEKTLLKAQQVAQLMAEMPKRESDYERKQELKKINEDAAKAEKAKEEAERPSLLRKRGHKNCS